MATAATQQQDVSRVPRSFYRPELDVLRFFAFFAVFSFHIGFRDTRIYVEHGVPAWLGEIITAFTRAGNLGVDLFFLLSAYLITTLLLREKEATGSVHLRSFYVRRILRIWPLYFLALGLAAFWFLLFPGNYMPWRYVVAYIFLAGNWMTVFYGPPGSPFVVLWSVAVEEQFYLTWPTVLRKLNSRRALFIFGGFLLCFSIAVRFFIDRGPHTAGAIWSNTLARLDGIATGIMIAAALGNKVPNIRPALRLLFFGAGLFGALLSGGYFTHAQISVRFIFTVAAATSTCFFFAFVGSSFSPKPLVYFGKISYGLYVYHMMCLEVCGQLLSGSIIRTRLGYLLYVGFTLVSTIVIAALSYRFFESPFLRFKERFTAIHSRPV